MLRALSTAAPVAALLLGLADTAAAQSYVIKTRNIEGPPSYNISGGPGNTELIGTLAPDRMTDIAPNDGDWFYDGPLGTDGQPDHIDARDGDGFDKIWCGPEDTVVGDPGDQITISAHNGGPLWTGTYEEYKRLKGIVRWLRDRLQALFATSPTNGEPDFWLNAFTYVSAELSAVTPSFAPGESKGFGELFAIGPYEAGDVPESPQDCLNWMVYLDDPISETAALDYTEDQFGDSVDAALALLDFLIADVSGGS